MLVILGFLIIAALLIAVMPKKMSPITDLIGIPVVSDDASGKHSHPGHSSVKPEIALTTSNRQTQEGFHEN